MQQVRERTAGLYGQHVFSSPEIVARVILSKATALGLQVREYLGVGIERIGRKDVFVDHVDGAFLRSQRYRCIWLVGGFLFGKTSVDINATHIAADGRCHTKPLIKQGAI